MPGQSTAGSACCWVRELSAGTTCVDALFTCLQLDPAVIDVATWPKTPSDADCGELLACTSCWEAQAQGASLSSSAHGRCGSVHDGETTQQLKQELLADLVWQPAAKAVVPGQRPEHLPVCWGHQYRCLDPATRTYASRPSLSRCKQRLRRATGRAAQTRRRRCCCVAALTAGGPPTMSASTS